MSDPLKILREKCLACRDCSLGGREISPKCFSNVFSNMNPTPIVVVGQNPGRDEVKQGEPFVGASGRFFNEAAKGIIGMERSSFYISNVCRCFSPGNRQPTRQELDACRPILDEEISIIKPTLIIALGSVAFERLTGMHGIMKHHGETVVSPRYLVPVIALLHPSPYNTNNPTNREMFHDGLRKVGDFLRQAKRMKSFSQTGREWELKSEKMSRDRKTYLNVDVFLEDMSRGKMMDGFFLSEEVFQLLSAKIQLDRELAKQITDMAVVLLLKADGKREVEDLLAIAESFVNG